MKKKKMLKVLNKSDNIKLCFRQLAADIQESNLRGCKIELIFNKEAIIDGCKAVSDYGDSRITLNVEGGLFIIDGSDLHLYSFENGRAVIRGTFTTIGFDT